MVIVLTARNTMEKTERLNKRYEETGRVNVDVDFKVVTGKGGKGLEDGGEGKFLRWEIRGSTDREN